MNYLYGFASTTFTYWALSYLVPAQDSLLDTCIYDDPDIIDSGDSIEQSTQDLENVILQEKGNAVADKSGRT